MTRLPRARLQSYTVDNCDLTAAGSIPVDRFEYKARSQRITMHLEVSF